MVDEGFTIEVLYERGRAAHPDLTLDRDRFAAHMRRCAACLQGDPSAVHAEDLFLACAALEGRPGAFKKLKLACSSAIVRYLGAIDPSPGFLSEIEQRLWEALMVGSLQALPKLGIYAGRGSLAGFVGISAQRIALTFLRRQAAEMRARAEAATVAALPRREPTSGVFEAQHEQDVQAAIRDALALLSDRERMIYRLHVIDGLTLDRIAKVYGVSQPTVSRWIGKARETVVAETRRLLRKRLRLSDSTADLVIGLVISRLDVSVSQLLGPAPTGCQ